MNNRFRRSIVAANWKMNKTPSETKWFMYELLDMIPKGYRCDVTICVPAICIPAVTQKRFTTRRIHPGAQDCSAHHAGAYTGEIAANMLADAGCKYVIIGHSERRAMGDTDQIVNAKLHAALNAGLTPIVCVGDGPEQQESGTSKEWIAMQVKAGLDGISRMHMRKIIFAYEPLWAEGSVEAVTPKQAGNACAHIRNVIQKLFDGFVARTVPILYGGDMNEEFAKIVLMHPDIDGGLIGERSLVPEEFAEIVKVANDSVLMKYEISQTVLDMLSGSDD